jgi:hypothetical protein
MTPPLRMSRSLAGSVSEGRSKSHLHHVYEKPGVDGRMASCFWRNRRV